jgi:hypothetical protein
MGNCPSPTLWWSVCMSATVASLSYPKLPGGSLQTHLLQQACLSTVCMDACSTLSRTQGAPPSLLHVFCNSLLFSFFFCGAEVSLSRGLCWFVPEVAVEVLHAAHLLTCWSVSPKQVRNWHLVVQEPSWFLCIIWCGEAMCGMVVQGCQIFVSSWFFLPGMSPAS